MINFSVPQSNPQNGFLNSLFSGAQNMQNLDKQNIINKALPEQIQQQLLHTQLQNHAQAFQNNNPLLSMPGVSGLVGLQNYLQAKNTPQSGGQSSMAQTSGFPTANVSTNPTVNLAQATGMMQPQGSSSANGGNGNPVSNVSMNDLIHTAMVNQLSGPQMTGAAGDVQGLEKLKSLYGPNSQQYQQALNLFNAKENSLNNRRMPTILKMQQAYNQAVASGNTQQAQELAGAIQKQSGTTQNIDRSTYANAIRQTLNSIPVNDIQNFSGPSGQLNLLGDRALNTIGMAPQSYNNYQSFLMSTLPLLKGQMTKFYGGSVQPDAQAELSVLGDPSTWRSNPQAAHMALQKLQDIFNSEAKTFSDASNYGSGQFKNAQIPGLAPSAGQGANVSPASTFQTNFNTKKEAVNYYNGLSPSQKLAYRQHIGGG